LYELKQRLCRAKKLTCNVLKPHLNTHLCEFLVEYGAFVYWDTAPFEHQHMSDVHQSFVLTSRTYEDRSRQLLQISINRRTIHLLNDIMNPSPAEKIIEKNQNYSQLPPGVDPVIARTLSRVEISDSNRFPKVKLIWDSVTQKWSIEPSRSIRVKGSFLIPSCSLDIVEECLQYAATTQSLEADVCSKLDLCRQGNGRFELFLNMGAKLNPYNAKDCSSILVCTDNYTSYNEHSQHSKRFRPSMRFDFIEVMHKDDNTGEYFRVPARLVGILSIEAISAQSTSPIVLPIIQHLEQCQRGVTMQHWPLPLFKYKMNVHLCHVFVIRNDLILRPLLGIREASSYDSSIADSDADWEQVKKFRFYIFTEGLVKKCKRRNSQYANEFLFDL
jgi:hypothetical protein